MAILNIGQITMAIQKLSLIIKPITQFVSRMTPTETSPRFFLAISSRFIYFEARFKLSPMAESVRPFLTPIVSRSQPGVAAAMHPFVTDKAPKTLMDDHAKPGAPLFPNAKD